MEHVSQAVSRALDESLSRRLLRIEDAIHDLKAKTDELAWMCEVLRKLYNANQAPPTGGKN